ncbi:hypothetical protein Mal65_21810 [Crateriforma conspicua]|nr:hypothetical protein Mal65_21810 [Crateriforma conspicua]
MAVGADLEALNRCPDRPRQPIRHPKLGGEKQATLGGEKQATKRPENLPKTSEKGIEKGIPWGAAKGDYLATP